MMDTLNCAECRQELTPDDDMCTDAAYPMCNSCVARYLPEDKPMSQSTKNTILYVVVGVIGFIVLMTVAVLLLSQVPDNSNITALRQANARAQAVLDKIAANEKLVKNCAEGHCYTN